MQKSARERRATHDNLLVFGDRLLIFIVIDGRVEDLDAVVGNVVEDPGLELGDLLVGHGVRLGNNGNQVDLLVQSTHELIVNGAQAVTASASASIVALVGEQAGRETHA